MADLNDTLAGRYQLEAPLGAGGMGSVFRARDVVLGRQVAVKVLASNMVANPDHLERFGREARAMAALSHPNLVAIHDVGWTDEGAGQAPFLVMELVTGGTLADRLAAEGSLEPAEVATIIEGLASALAALHGAGIVHRDVKPQNVLLAPSGPKLGDLGIARIDDPTAPDEAALTVPGSTLGTLRFIAPETIYGQSVGPQADAYALAIVAFEALTGRSPRPTATLGDLVHGAWQPAMPVSEAKPALGTGFDAVFEAALEVDPERRLEPLAFATALREAAETWAESAPVVDTATAVGTATAVEPEPAIDAAPTNEEAPHEAETIIEAPAAADAPPIVEPAAAVAPGLSIQPDETATWSGVANPNPIVDRPQNTTFIDRPATEGSTPTNADPLSRIVAGLGILVLVVGVVVVGLLISQGGSPGPSGSGPGASGSTLPSDSSPVVTTDPGAAAREALGTVLTAIEGARGGRDGLKGDDANELTSLANAVGRALDQGDFDAARTAFDELAARAAKLSKGLDKTRREALDNALDALGEAIPQA